MAKTLESHNFGTRSGGASYDWDLWMDGQIWCLDRADFNGKDPKEIAGTAWQAARARRLKLKMSISSKDGTMVIQTTPMTAEEIKEYEAKLEAKKATDKAKKNAEKALAALVNGQPATPATQTETELETDESEVEEEPKTADELYAEYKAALAGSGATLSKKKWLAAGKPTA